MRAVTHRYVDPLDALWLGAAKRMGFRIERTADVYASTDGAGTIWLGTTETLDADDCLAQLIFHELCHALVQGPVHAGRPDWGLDNETDRDQWREHACLRLQALLAAPHGLREVLAPTTDHRAFYDALPADPLTPPTAPDVVAARLGAARAERDPFGPHLAEALAATALIIRAAATLFDDQSNDQSDDQSEAPLLLRCVQEPIAKHASGFPQSADPKPRCGECAWFFVGGSGRAVPRCRQADNARVGRDDRACERFEPHTDCATCGACCREGFDAVPVARTDPTALAHPELVRREGQRRWLLRDGPRCAALEGPPFSCRIYAERPTACRDLEQGGEHCLTARRRVGLSR